MLIIVKDWPKMSKFKVEIGVFFFKRETSKESERQERRRDIVPDIRVVLIQGQSLHYYFPKVYL